jgi:hypothetical protein
VRGGLPSGAVPRGGSSQLPLLESAGAASRSFLPHADGPYSICGETAAAGEATVESNGIGEWKLSRRINGFELELDLALHERDGGFVNDRHFDDLAHLCSDLGNDRADRAGPVLSKLAPVLRERKFLSSRPRSCRASIDLLFDLRDCRDSSLLSLVNGTLVDATWTRIRIGPTGSPCCGML